VPEVAKEHPTPKANSAPCTTPWCFSPRNPPIHLLPDKLLLGLRTEDVPEEVGLWRGVPLPRRLQGGEEGVGETHLRPGTVSEYQFHIPFPHHD